jgi:hypothetical protein
MPGAKNLNEGFCFFFQKEALSFCSLLKKTTKKRSFMRALLDYPIARELIFTAVRLSGMRRPASGCRGRR